MVESSFIVDHVILGLLSLSMLVLSILQLLVDRKAIYDKMQLDGISVLLAREGFMRHDVLILLWIACLC